MHKHEVCHLVELLVRLGGEYRHLQQEHDREPLDHPTRHVLEVKVRQLGERFERLLSHWVHDEALRQQWTQYLHADGPPPDAPRFAMPPDFKGLTDAGAQVEVRASEEGGYDLIVDGRVESHESVPWYLDPDQIPPHRIGRYLCREIFDAPAEAVQALSAFLVTPEAEPPWIWSRALFEDGLIDDNFGLTPRGQRRLGKGAPRPVEATGGLTFGILTADAARARMFVLRTTEGDGAPTLAPLVEVAQTTSPEQRARDNELLSDTRPGLRREGPHGPRHGVSDHREGHREDAERRFAAQLVDEAEQIWRANNATRVMIIASPAMLGALRAAMKSSHPRPWTVSELARDLTRLTAPALHDVLAGDGVLPPRGRRSPLRPMPGRPI